MSDATILYSTAPDRETAQKIADALIADKLAACVNILAPMIAVYEWEGAVERSEETPMLVKTTKAAAPAARDRILALHPYDCPCVAALAIDADGSSAPFLEWIAEAVRGNI